MHKRIILAAASAAFLFPVSEGYAFQNYTEEKLAYVISHTTPGDMATLLTSFGWEATTTADNAGGPEAVKITFNGYSSWLRLKDCQDDAPDQCVTLLFFANWDLGRDVTQGDMLKLNKYNDVNVVGRTYFLNKSDQVGIDFVISLKGGVTRQHLIQQAERWDNIIDKFVDNFRDD